MYNRRKTRREWYRQSKLKESWEHIYTSLSDLEDKNKNVDRNKFRQKTVVWCRQELRFLRKLNQGFPSTSPESGVRLLLSRVLGNTDNLQYNVQQLKVQSLGYI